MLDKSRPKETERYGDGAKRQKHSYGESQSAMNNEPKIHESVANDRVRHHDDKR
jgi:hypothetical protein